MRELKQTMINPLLDLHYVDRMGIKLDISEAAKIAESRAKTNAERGRYAKLCGWAEVSYYPNRYREFWSVWGEMVFNGFHGNKTNLPLLLESRGIKYWEQPQVHWLWFSPLLKKEGINILYKLYKTLFPNIEFVTVTSETTSNEDVEAKINDVIKKYPDKQIVVLSLTMGSRSCSVGKLYYSHLCFDGGSDGSNTQKGMRPTTTDLDNLNKIAVIISHSFNTNTDDKLDLYILEANKINGNGGIQQTIEFAREVFPIYVAGDRGLVYEDYTEFITGVIDRGSGPKVAVSRIDISNIPTDYIQRVSNGNTDSNSKSESLETTTSRKTIRGTQSNGKSKKDNTEDKFRVVCKKVIDDSHYIIAAGRSYGVNSILESFDFFEKDLQFNILKKDIENKYGIKYEDLKKLFLDKIIDTDWCDMNAIVKLNKKLCL